MKILWVSNHPDQNSGYGSQTRQVGRRLTNDHEVAFLANFGRTGISAWNGLPVFGSGDVAYSIDVITDTFARSGSEVAISLFDGWVYDQNGADKDPFAGIPTAGWLPVDHLPCPPAVSGWASRHLSIAMSKFGQAQLADAGIEALYVPHALEPVFRPTPTSEHFPEGLRRLIGVRDDQMLVTIVAANTGTAITDRKGWSEMLQAMAHFAKRHDDVVFYIHTRQMGVNGAPLPVAIKLFGEHLEPRVHWADQWALKQELYTDADMAAIYTGSDVLLMTSRGEGFGIPAIEAQACGCPVIVSDWTAQSELVGGGWAVPVQPEIDWKHGTFLGIPNISAIVDALEQAYAKRGDPELRAAALAKGAEYAADTVYETYWKPALARLERHLGEYRARAPRSVNTAIRPKRKRRAA